MLTAKTLNNFEAPYWFLYKLIMQWCKDQAKTLFNVEEFQYLQTDLKLLCVNYEIPSGWDGLLEKYTVQECMKFPKQPS